MPTIQMTISNLTKEQKSEIVKSFTKAASEVTKIAPEAFTVIIYETPLENIGVGGELLADRFAKGGK